MTAYDMKKKRRAERSRDENLYAAKRGRASVALGPELRL